MNLYFRNRQNDLKIPNHIAYSPNSTDVRDIVIDSMCYLAQQNGNPFLCGVLGFYIDAYPNASTLEEKLIDPTIGDKTLCGIQFDDNLAGQKLKI